MRHGFNYGFPFSLVSIQLHEALVDLARQLELFDSFGRMSKGVDLKRCNSDNIIIDYGVLYYGQLCEHDCAKCPLKFEGKDVAKFTVYSVIAQAAFSEVLT